MCRASAVPLHRHPTAVHRHREGRVDEQRHGRLRPRLRLLHLDVADLDPDHRSTIALVCRRLDGRPVRCLAQHGIGDRARHVPGLGVAELPLAGGAAAFAGGAGTSQVALALPSGHPLRDVAQQRLAELAHGLRAQPQLTVRAAFEVPGVAQRLLESLQRAGVDRRLGAQLARQLVEVDIVHPRPAVGLRELLGEGVELREVLQHPGAVAQAEALLAVEAFRAAQSSPGRSACRLLSDCDGTDQLGGAEGLRREGVELVALLLGHGVAHPLCRGGPLGQGVERSSSTLRGFSGKKSPCLSMNSRNCASVSPPRDGAIPTAS